MLSRFGLQLLRSLQVRDQREVNHQGVVGSEVPAHLPHRFNEGEGFNVTDRSAYLSNDKIVLAGFAQQEDVALDFVRDVGDYLNRFAQVFALALLGDHVIVYPPGGHVVGLGRGYVEKSFVVAQVQVGFGTIVGNIAFPVFVGVKRTRVDVDVGVEFLDGDGKTAGL